MSKIQIKISPSAIDFIGIGAHRAGTTWLHHHLNALDEFWLPPIKELHYFDRAPVYPSPDTLSEPYLINRITKRIWLEKVVRNFGRQVINGNLKNIKWLAKLHFSTYNDAWYLSLFKPGDRSRIKGEITPAYAILKPDDIQKMYHLVPEAKILFLIRNPIDRAWSHYRYSLERYPSKVQSLKSIPAMMDFFNREAQELRSNYLQTLRNYLEYFPADQILIGFYDAILEQPQQLLREIITFLQGDTSKTHQGLALETKVNASSDLKVPQKIKAFLQEKYFAQIQELSTTFGGYCTKWLQEIDKSQHRDSIPKPATVVLNKKLF